MITVIKETLAVNWFRVICGFERLPWMQQKFDENKQTRRGHVSILRSRKTAFQAFRLVVSEKCLTIGVDQELLQQPQNHPHQCGLRGHPNPPTTVVTVRPRWITVIYTYNQWHWNPQKIPAQHVICPLTRSLRPGSLDYCLVCIHSALSASWKLTITWKFWLKIH